MALYAHMFINIEIIMFIINLVAVDWYVQNCEVTFYL